MIRLLSARSVQITASRRSAAEPLDFDLQGGEVLQILGPIGSGKSLLAERLAGIARPDTELTGKLEWLAGAVPAVVHQDPRLTLLPADDVAEALEDAALQGKASGRPAWVQDQALLSLLRLTQLRKDVRLFHTLSGSERDRVLLAIAILKRPSVLVIDGALEMMDSALLPAWLEVLAGWVKNGLSLLVFGRIGLTLPGISSRSVDLSPSTAPSLPLLPKTPSSPPGASEFPVIRLRGVSLSVRSDGWFRKWSSELLLRNVDLKVSRGEVVAILGPSESGKTSLLHTMAGLKAPQSGRLIYLGSDITLRQKVFLARSIRDVQLVFQDALPAFDPGRTVREHLLDAGRLAGEEGTPDLWLGRVGLGPEILDTPADYLSLGEAQRVLLARSLALRPKLVLWDTPRVAGAESDMILPHLIAAEKARGTAFVLATSDLSLAEHLADRIYLMSEGTIQAIGRTVA